MKFKSVLAILFAAILFSGNCYAAPTRESSLTKKRFLSDLDSIHNIFAVKYAPIKWKGEYANWNLDQAILEAKNKINILSPNPTLKECQIVLRDFFNSTRDYHVGVRFYSTESASLPFLVKGAENRYFICDVDSEVFLKGFPFEVGDEILTFGGLCIHDVINELREQEYGSNTYETDMALAEMTLTNRHGAMGHRVPKGSVVITGKKKGEDTVTSATIEWDYVPERIHDFSKLGANFAVQTTLMERKPDLKSTLKKSKFFEKFMMLPHWDRIAGMEMNNHTLGSRSSYLPLLGTKVWETSAEWVFDAYIFKTSTGKNIGYIRIPHYVADVEELEEFGRIMNFFEDNTDALVIDQLNNPGGQIFYLYALVSTLTDKPFYAPKHHISLTQEEVHTALFLLPRLELVNNDATARSVLGDEVGGYPVNYEFICLMKQFCHFLIDQWNQGKLYTDPTHFFGVDKIMPHPHYQYTRPVLLLVNSLNFSGGDFFPAILQDNNRATLMGTRTAGAGGYVLHTSFPNHSGIKGFVMTGSHAERIDKKPIENLGVKPDIFYPLTPEDLQGGYQPFAQAIVKTVESLTK